MSSSTELGPPFASRLRDILAASGLAIVLAGCGSASTNSADPLPESPPIPSIRPLVVGGTPAPVDRFPCVGALISTRDGGSAAPLCTGILIDDVHVLTAAHCVVLNRNDSLGFDWSVNTEARAGADVVPVASAEASPDFTVNPGDAAAPIHDIAVLTLSRAVTTECRFGPSEAPASGAAVTVAGYGPTTEALAPNHVLNDATTTISSVTTTEFVVTPAPSPQPCFGDSGGPAFSNATSDDILVGIASRAAVPTDEVCSRGGVYTRVDAFRDWIDGVTSASPSLSSDAGGGCDMASRPAEPRTTWLLLAAASAVVRHRARRGSGRRSAAAV